MKRPSIKRHCLTASLLLIISGCALLPGEKQQNAQSDTKKPNILWIVAEDLSPFMGAYNDPINTGFTPVIDKLANNGVLFERAFSSAPVCSAARSALITGVMQTTIGAMHHRSSRTTESEIVPENVRINLPNNMKTIPELMKDAGYFTFNSGKDDYNFHYDRRALYDVGSKKDYVAGMNGWQGNSPKDKLSITDHTWNARPNKAQPWFGQIQIMGGKAGKKHTPKNALLKDNDVPLPAYFPDIPSQRKAWTEHYNANRGADVRVKAILDQLAADGELENTIIFFFSDHGSPSSLRHKQYVYEGGMQIPLIVKGQHPSIKTGSKRHDLVSILDISATTLALGDAKMPRYLDGQNLFSTTYQEQKYIIGARDRCDFTIDRIRTVRSDNFRYIKNYFTDRPRMQASYRDHKKIVQDLVTLHKKGKLTPYQEKHWFGERAPEELYDLAADPLQMNNLANNQKFAKILEEHRKVLNDWIIKTGDKGQVQESDIQLKQVFDLWKNKKQFKNAEKLNPEYDQFLNP